MTILCLPTTIGESGCICAACNKGRVLDTTGRPTVEPSTVVNEIKFIRPGAITGHSIHLCDECLDDLRWVVRPGVEENDE